MQHIVVLYYIDFVLFVKENSRLLLFRFTVDPPFDICDVLKLNFFEFESIIGCGLDDLPLR